MQSMMDANNRCHEVLVKIRTLLKKNAGDNWVFYKTPNNKYNNFRMSVNNQKISVAISVFTSGAIETIFINNNDELDHDSIQQHTEPSDLIHYLHSL